MTLEINKEGRIVIVDASEQAIAFIEERRQKLIDPVHQHWYFSRIYEGTVYITATAEESKDGFVEMIDILIADYGLKTTPATGHILSAWRRDVAYTNELKRQHAEQSESDTLIRSLKRLLAEGCRGCEYFAVSSDGDDENGYCFHGECAKRLENSRLSMENGFDRRGVRYFGLKYYPCDTCRYLN